MPLECGTIVGFESRESNVGKLRPQQSNKVESRYALANPEDLAHQALRPVTPNRAPYSARCDDAQPAAVETVWKREQGQVAAPDAETLPLNAEELPAPPNPVVPRQCTIHDPRCREDPSTGSCTRYLTTRKDASAPSRGAVSGFPCRPWCSFACETRGSACAAGCLADKCASCPRRSRQFKAVHPRTDRIPNEHHKGYLQLKSTAVESQLVPCFTSLFRLSSLCGCGKFSVPGSQMSLQRDFHRVWKKLWKFWVVLGCGSA